MQKQLGKFIVIDGIDGSGKGTIAKQLAAFLFDLSKRNHILLTREPYISSYYDTIRRILKTTKDPREHALRLTKLFVQDRKVHARWIDREIRQGHIVISDRYWHSTLVYQQTQGIPLTALLEMHENIPVIPDLTLLIDLPAEVAMRRVANDEHRGGKRDMFEQVEFQKVLRQKFLSLPKYLPDEHIVIVSGNSGIERVFKSVQREVQKLFK
ncbi:MAG TPA: dTMP kinase [Candidatus Paceibacterota bacterium]